MSRTAWAGPGGSGGCARCARPRGARCGWRWKSVGPARQVCLGGRLRRCAPRLDERGEILWCGAAQAAPSSGEACARSGEAARSRGREGRASVFPLRGKCPPRRTHGVRSALAARHARSRAAGSDAARGAWGGAWAPRAAPLRVAGLQSFAPCGWSACPDLPPALSRYRARVSAWGALSGAALGRVRRFLSPARFARCFRGIKPRPSERQG